MPRGTQAADRKRRSDGTFSSSTAIEKVDSAPRVIRADVIGSPTTGLGRHNSKTDCNVWQPEFGQGQFVHENAFSSRGIIRRIVGQEPKDAMRKSWRVKGLEPDDQTKLDAFNQRREFDAKFTQLRELARKYGTAALFMDIDDGLDWAEPVNFQAIKRVGNLTVLDRWELDIRNFSHDLAKGEMYAPDAYFLVNMGTRQVHPSRMLVMHGIPLTARERMERGGFGKSIIDGVWKSLSDYLTANSYMAEALVRSTQGVLKMPSLEGSMTGCDKELVEDRMQMLSFWMSAIGDIALTGDESYEVVQRGLTGLAEVARAFFEIVVVDTEIPMTILGGSSPGGLNTGANAGEWQSWTSYLGGEQKRTYTPLVRQWMDVAFRAANSPVLEVPEFWDIDWPELYEPNIVEFSGAVAAITNAGVMLAMQGIYSNSEVRNNPVLTQAFPHEEGMEVETETPESQSEPETEELSISAEEFVESGADVQKSALNGAQMASLKELGIDVSRGTLPLETAIQMALFGFPTMKEKQARAMFDPTGKLAAEKPPETEPDGEAPA